MAKKVYFNDPQLECHLVGARTSVCVMGRRTGKTHGIAAPYILRCIQRMPGSTGGIVVPTFLHGLTNTIPGVLAALRSFGYYDNIHFVVGRQPPDFFKRPVIEPASYQHVISFYNGSVAILLSQDRSYAANSLTLSWLLVDEAKFIDQKKLHDQVIPANGGSKAHFGQRSLNHAMMVLSDMPQTKKGSWFLTYREKMDPEVIQVIKAQVHEIWRQKDKVRKLRADGQPVPAYMQDHIRKLDRQLNQLRSVATYYRECSSIENIALLGESYIKQMKRDLTPLVFRTSILCQRIGISRDGFYCCMTEDHKYDQSDFAYLDKLWQKDIVTPDGKPVSGRSSGITSGADADLNPRLPIVIGMDYNAKINWIVAGQPDGRRLNVIKSFYTKYERKIPELIADFCAYYRNHPTKHVIYYYDSTALGQTFFSNYPDIHESVVGEFRRHGWTVTDVYIGAPMHHDEKYRLINNGFTGRNNLTPYINRQNNEALLLAIETAGVETGRNGFRKDKSGEKLAESQEDLLEHRTDGTDAFDTLYIGCELFPRSSALSGHLLMTPGIV